RWYGWTILTALAAKTKKKKAMIARAMMKATRSPGSGLVRGLGGRAGAESGVSGRLHDHPGAADVDHHHGGALGDGGAVEALGPPALAPDQHDPVVVLAVDRFDHPGPLAHLAVGADAEDRALGVEAAG